MKEFCAEGKPGVPSCQMAARFNLVSGAGSASRGAAAMEAFSKSLEGVFILLVLVSGFCLSVFSLDRLSFARASLA